MSYRDGLDILGHGGGGHHGGGGRGFGRGAWGWWGGPSYVDLDEAAPTCDFYGPNGECYVRTPAGVRQVLPGGANIAVLGEVGLDIEQVNKAVRGAKPMSAAQAHKFITLALDGLADAEAHDPNGGPGATSRRVTLGNHLRSASTTIDATKVNPLPETAAELLRNLVLQSVAEYNAVAEGNETLRAARAQFFQDVYDNAVALYNKAGDKIDSATSTLKWALYIGAGAAGLTAVTFLTVWLRRR